MPVRNIVTKTSNILLSPLGLELCSKAALEHSQGFSNYLREAAAIGMDVNDWLDMKYETTATLPFLEREILAHLSEQSVICEIGPGTGRQSRHIAPRVKRLYLADIDPWSVAFLNTYFAKMPHVTAHRTSNCRLQFISDATCDAVLAFTVFSTLSLGEIYRYLEEFARILRPGGLVGIDYNDPDLEGAIDYIKSHPKDTYSIYHTANTIDRLFNLCSFSVTRVIACKMSNFVFGVRQQAPPNG